MKKDYKYKNKQTGGRLRTLMGKENEVYMWWFNFILGLNLFHHCFKLIVINYHRLKTKEGKFKPRIKLNPQHISLRLDFKYF